MSRYTRQRQTEDIDAPDFNERCEERDLRREELEVMRESNALQAEDLKLRKRELRYAETKTQAENFSVIASAVSPILQSIFSGLNKGTAQRRGDAPADNAMAKGITMQPPPIWKEPDPEAPALIVHRYMNVHEEACLLTRQDVDALLYAGECVANDASEQAQRARATINCIAALLPLSSGSGSEQPDPQQTEAAATAGTQQAEATATTEQQQPAVGTEQPLPPASDEWRLVTGTSQPPTE